VRSRGTNRRLIAIFGINAVREKNLYQTRWLSAHGFDIHAFSSEAAAEASDPSVVVEMVEPTTLRRLRQVWRFLRRHRAAVHHVEVIPSGRFALMYCLVAKALRLKLLVIDLGVLAPSVRRERPLRARLSMYAAFRLADRIWYKWPSAAPTVERWKPNRTFFLPNGVPVPPEPRDDRSIDFLWVNRITPWRYPEWFAGAIGDLARSNRVSCEMLGFRGPGTTPEQEQLEQRVRGMLASTPCNCRDYTDPAPFYRRARFFVLPSNMEAGNFGLLEAMSYGVVPILADGEGADLIIESGRNGMLVDPRPEAFLSAMRSALAVDADRWRSMSAAARRTIEDRFSMDRWGEQLLRQYDALVA
jgi:glycosyltransferase involved in cell wall biosynthesis